MNTHLTTMLILLLCLLAAPDLFAQAPGISGNCGLEGADTTALLLLTRPPVSQLPDAISTTHFVVHYATSGIDIFTQLGALTVGIMAESCWTVQCVRMGWRTPLPDGALGGDSRYDIYIRHFYNENPGTPIDTAGVTPKDAGTQTSYILLTNQFGGGTNPSNQTLAHEFNHSSQWSYTTALKPWTWEGTAEYMMKEVIRSQYIYDTYAAHASGSLTFANKKLTDQTYGHPYANALFFQFLQERWNDTDLVRSTWDRFGATRGLYPLSDINYVLLIKHATSLDSALRDYAIWRQFTGDRDDNYHFRNGSAYATALEASFTPPFTMSNSSSLQKPSGPGGCRYWNIRTGIGTLTVNFDGQDNHAWAVYLIGMHILDSSKVYKIPLTSALDTGSISVSTAGADSFTVVPVVLDTSNADNLLFSVTATFTAGTEIAFSNRIHGAEAGGKLLLDNVDTVISGQSRSLAPGSTHIVRTLNERFVIPGDSTYKHHDWKQVASKFRMADTFQVVLFQPELANFVALNSVTIRNEIIGAPNFDGGTIQFKDPWYLNSSGAQPDSFIAFPSPHSPTGAANQTTGGVFLNQGTDIPGNPFYSIRVPLTQTIGNFQCTFVDWDVSGGSLVQIGSNPSGYDQKAVVFNSANAVVKALYRAITATITAQVSSPQWNIVSVPDTVSDFRKIILWPTAITSAYAYQNGVYVRKDTVANGAGYWLKFPSSQGVSYVGPPIFVDTISLGAGWNLIGSISFPLGTSKIIKSDSDTSMHLSEYWRYSGVYSVADTIKPGYGYWVKSDKMGALILNVASTANEPQSTSTETPPEAPGPPSPPEALSPPNGTTNVPMTATLSWAAVPGATSYSGYLDTDPNFSSEIQIHFVSTTAQAVVDLNCATPYYWHVMAINDFGSSDWSVTNSLTTEVCPPAPYVTWVSVLVGGVKHPKLSWTVPAGLTSPYYVYRYFCALNVGDCMASGSMIATTSALNYTDLEVNVADKTHPAVSTAYYYVKATVSGGGLSASSNKAIVNTSNISWQAGRGENQEEELQNLEAYTLSPNYPNPFNPTTTIHYTLPEDQYVQLVVINVLGQEVARLVDGFESAGYKKVEFQAGSLPSGIYYYHLKAGMFEDVKKMLIAK